MLFKTAACSLINRLASAEVIAEIALALANCKSLNLNSRFESESETHPVGRQDGGASRI
jgi:hypothetical protein